MPPTFVQTAPPAYVPVGNAGLCTTTFGASTTAGNAVFVGIQLFSTGSVANAPTGGSDTFVVAKNDTAGLDGPLVLYYAANITGGWTTLSDVPYLMAGPQYDGMLMVAQEWTNIAPSGLDVTATGSGTTSVSTGTTASTTQASELVIGLAGTGRGFTSFTAPAGWSNLTQKGSSPPNDSLAMASLVVSSMGAQGGVFGGSSMFTSQGLVATFKAVVPVVFIFQRGVVYQFPFTLVHSFEDIQANFEAIASYKPSWNVPVLINSWANLGAPWETAGYLKDAMGFVHLRGVLKSGTSATTAFVLPAGFRPGLAGQYASNGAGTNVAYVTVDASGNVIPNGTGVGTSVPLSGITFLAEN